MRIVWSLQAMADFAALRAYISQDDPAAAERMADRILHDIETQLPANPRMGRPGRVPSTRELVILKTPYIVPYRIEGHTIEILRVYHGARRWPKRV
jgi:toxin ParE1/3/4